MKVKIKKMHPDAVVPSQTYASDFCFDVYATSEEEVAPNVWKYRIGWAFQIDRGLTYPDYMKLSIDFRPRSSVWKTGMVLSNGEGTIDESYTGEVFAVFYHLFPNLERYHKGDKIGQIKIGTALPIEFKEVDSLLPTERGSNGCGSTGRK